MAAAVAQHNGTLRLCQMSLILPDPAELLLQALTRNVHNQQQKEATLFLLLDRHFNRSTCPAGLEQLS
jgi:hypothetical protein